MSERQALIIVDVQNDFCSGGSLAVAGGDEVVAPLNEFIAYALPHDWLGIVTQDWHPEHTVHFTQDRDDEAGWPVHCVQDTRGAQLHQDLNVSDGMVVIRKGIDPTDDGGYSAFDGHAPDGRSLRDLLNDEGVGEVYVGGLATDWCVKATALDAVRYGFRVYLLLDAIQAVNLEPDDGAEALEEMQNAGVVLTSVKELLPA